MLHAYQIWLILRLLGWLLALIRCLQPGGWSQPWALTSLALAALWLTILALYPSLRAGRGPQQADSRDDPFWKRPLRPTFWQQRWLRWEAQGAAPLLEIFVSSLLLLTSGGLDSPLHEFVQTSLVAPALSYGPWGALAATGYFLAFYAWLLAGWPQGAAEWAQFFSPIQGGALALLLGEMLRRQKQRHQEEFQTLQLRERQSWIRELHDGAAQTQYALTLSMENLAADLHQDLPQEDSRMRRLVFLSRQALLEIRQAMVDPSLLWDDPIDLPAMIRRLARDLESVSEIEFELDLSPEVAFADWQRVHVYRFIQEAFSNIFKYSEARRAGLGLRSSSSSAWLEIWDAGCGFEESQVRPGVGLKSLAKRAQTLGGKFECISKPGQGTRIYLEWDPQTPPPSVI